jgi:amino-acid N-acetyltransferase
MEYQAEGAQPPDLAGVLDLLHRCDLPVTGVTEHFRNFLVVRVDVSVAGVAGLEPCGEDGLLRSVAVEPAYRGTGVGKVLMDGVLGLAQRLELRSLYLLTTTAREYFCRLGFSDCPREEAPAAIRETWEFRSGCPSGSAFMRRSL